MDNEKKDLNKREFIIGLIAILAPFLIGLGLWTWRTTRPEYPSVNELPGNRALFSQSWTAVPGLYLGRVDSAQYTTSIPPTRTTDDPLYTVGSRHVVGFECYTTLAELWPTCPATCTDGIVLTSIANCFSQADSYTVTLPNGSIVDQPVMLTIADGYYGEDTDSPPPDGSYSDPYNYVNLPTWMSAYQDKFQLSTSGHWYNYVKYNADFTDVFTQLLNSIANTYNSDPQLAAVNLAFGFELETHIGKPTGPGDDSFWGTYMNDLKEAYDPDLTCADYVDRLQTIGEYAVGVFDKPVFLASGSVNACWDDPTVYTSRLLLQSLWEEKWYETPVAAAGTPIPVGAKSNNLAADFYNADAPDAFSAGRLYNTYVFGNHFGYDPGVYNFPIAFEIGALPSDTNIHPGDDWQNFYWTVLQGAGSWADFINTDGWQWRPYYSPYALDVTDFWLGARDTRAWIVWRDKEYATYMYGSTGISGKRGNFSVWLTDETGAETACTSALTTLVNTRYNPYDSGIQTPYPCAITTPMPTPVTAYAATPSAIGRNQETLNRLLDRQAGVIEAGEFITISVSTDWDYYGETGDLALDIFFLDLGGTITVTVDGDAHTLTTATTGDWEHEAWTASAADIVNTDGYLIKIESSSRTYIHGLYYDVDESITPTPPPPTNTPTLTPTPTNTSSPTPTNTPTATPVPGIYINEISPNELYDWNLGGDVTTADRWFELFNAYSTNWNLANYYVVSIGASNMYTYTFGTDLIRDSNFRIFLAEDVLSIPITGTLKLYSPADQELDSVTWGSQDAGKCYAAVPDGSDSFSDNRICTAGRTNVY